MFQVRHYSHDKLSILDVAWSQYGLKKVRIRIKVNVKHRSHHKYAIRPGARQKVTFLNLLQAKILTL